MPINKPTLSTTQPGVPEAHAEAEPRAPHQRLGAAASMPPDNGPPRRSQPPVQGPPAPRSGGPSVDRGLQAKPAVSQDHTAKPAGAQAIMGPLPDVPETPDDPEQREQFEQTEQFDQAQQKVYGFAMSFPGKNYSPEVLEEMAKNTPTTLEEARAKLFMHAIASRQVDDFKYLETYKELKPLLEEYSKPAPT